MDNNFFGAAMPPSGTCAHDKVRSFAIVTPQGIEKVMIKLKDTPSKVYAIGAELFLSKVPLEVLQN